MHATRYQPDLTRDIGVVSGGYTHLVYDTNSRMLVAGLFHHYS